MLLKKVRNTTTTALAIMADSILLVQVGQGDGRVQVAAYGTEPIPEGCFSDTGLRDPQQLGRAVRALWSRVGVKDRAAAVVLPSVMCGLRSVRLPDLPEAERRSVLRGELEHSQAIPYHGGAFDFIWVKEPAEVEPAPAEAFALYTSEEIVNDLRTALRQADLQLAALEPLSVGVFRACALADPRPEPRAALCLDEGTSDFCILEGGQLRYLRRIASGWADLRNLLEDPPPSGAAPRPEPVEGGRTEAGAATLAPSMLSAKPGTPFLMAETVRSLAYYARAHGNDQRPSTLAIAAAQPDFVRLEGYFRDASVPTPTVVDPGPAFGLELPPALSETGGTLVAHALAAIGTAASLAGFTPSITRLDLAKEDPATKVHNPWGAALVPTLIGSAVWLILTVAAWVILGQTNEAASLEETRLEARLADTKAQQAPLMQLQALQEDALGFKKKSEIPAAALLGQVAGATHPEATLKQLTVDANQMVTLSGEAVVSDSVLQYAYSLGNGRSIKQPRITLIRQREDGYVEFQIAGKLMMTPPEAVKAAETAAPAAPEGGLAVPETGLPGAQAQKPEPAKPPAIGGVE